MLKIFRTAAFTIFSGLVLTAANAAATTITATTYNSWKTSLSGTPTELDFSGVHLTSYNTSTGLILAAMGNSSLQFDFTGPDNGAYQLSGTTYQGIMSLEGASDTGAAINVTTPAAGENAILVSIASTSGTPLTLTLSDGESFSLSSGVFGMSISHPVTSVFITTTSGSRAVINDFYFGTSSLTQDGGQGNQTPTPEAATLLLTVGGLSILLGARRKFGLVQV